MPELILTESGADARAHAVSLAVGGGEAGLFVWRPAAERIDCAVVLRPEETREQIMPVVLVASLALLDAVGSAGPAAVAADLVWPAGLRINSGLCGGIALDLGPGDNPEWAVVSAVLRKTGEPGAEGGERPDETALYNEGFADMADRDLIDSLLKDRNLEKKPDFYRHSRYWLYRSAGSGRCDGGRQ